MPDSPFYLGVLNNPSKFSQVWFKSQPMGHDKLGSIMKCMAQKAGLSNGKYTNHSVRKTMINQLLHAGVNPNIVIQLSGHKSLQSLQNYNVASLNQQKSMANILCGNTSANRGILGSSQSQNTADVRALPQPPAASCSSACSELTGDKGALVESVQKGQAQEFQLFSQQNTKNSMCGLFTGAIFNGTVNFNFK